MDINVRISEAEWEAFLLVCIGKTAKEIGTILHKSRKTVETQLSHIYHKLGTNNSRDAILIAIKLNLITLDYALQNVLHPAEVANIDISALVRHHMTNEPIRQTIEVVCTNCRQSTSIEKEAILA